MSQTARTLLQVEYADDEGQPVSLHIAASPQGVLFAVIPPAGEYYQIRLCRADVQQVRIALTEWLVDAAPTPPAKPVT